MKINQTKNKTENWATGEGDFEPGLKQASMATKENRRITINTPLTECEIGKDESTNNLNNPNYGWIRSPKSQNSAEHS